MKILGTIGLILGGIGLIMAVYLQFVVAENAAIAESNRDFALENSYDQYIGSAEQDADFDAMDLKTDMGIYTMFAGMLAVLLSLVPAIKKEKMAWGGLLLGLIAFFVGAAYGTHMFS